MGPKALGYRRETQQPGEHPVGFLPVGVFTSRFPPGCSFPEDRSPLSRWMQ